MLTGTIASFHHTKSTELDNLCKKSPLTPEELTAFVTNYTAEFDIHFPKAKRNMAQRIPLFKTACKKYFQLYAGQLDQLKGNPNKSIKDLAALIAEFVENFPQGDNALIHWQDTEELTLFQNKILENLNLSLAQSTDGTYHEFAHGHPRQYQCIEAVLLQNLAKLPIPLSTKPLRIRTQDSHLKTYKENIQRLLASTTRFVERTPRACATMTMTLSALSYFDVGSLQVTDFVKRCKQQFLASPSNNNAASIIRAVHSMILLSNEKDGFKTHLSPQEAGQLLNRIRHMALTATDSSLANQLHQIRNIYREVFPEELSKTIAPFSSYFQEQAHGSRFENIVSDELALTTNALMEKYHGLINHKYFNNNNPLCAELGLESDFSYEYGTLHVCIQIDGDKYHLYPGTQTKTQRTKLRDHAFKEQNWKVISFSGNDSGDSDIDKASQVLFENIVIPTYDIMTNNTIKAIENAKSELPRQHSELKQLLSNDENLDQITNLKQTLVSLKKLNLPEYKEATNKLEKNIIVFEVHLTTSHELLASSTRLLAELTHFDLSQVKISVSDDYQRITNELARLKQQQMNLDDELKTAKRSLAQNTSEKLTLNAKIEKECVGLSKAMAENVAKGYAPQIRTLENVSRGLQDKIDAIPQQIALFKQKANNLQNQLAAINALIAKPIVGNELVARCQEMTKKFEQIKQNQAQFERSLSKVLAEAKTTLTSAAKQNQLNVLRLAKDSNVVFVPAATPLPPQPAMPTPVCAPQYYGYSDNGWINVPSQQHYLPQYSVQPAEGELRRQAALRQYHESLRFQKQYMQNYTAPHSSKR